MAGQVAVLLLSPTMSRTLIIVTRTLYRVLLTVTHDLHGGLHALQAAGGGGASGLKRKNQDEQTHICNRCESKVCIKWKTNGRGSAFEYSASHFCNGKKASTTPFKELTRIKG